MLPPCMHVSAWSLPSHSKSDINDGRYSLDLHACLFTKALARP